MKDILFVSNSQSMLVSSLMKLFTEKDYSAGLTSGVFKEISELHNRPEAVIVFADDKLNEQQQTLVYLRDKCLGEDIPIFTIGDPDELAEIYKILPESVTPKKYLRPVNVKEVFEEIDEYLEQHNTDNKRKILVVDDSGAMLRSIKSWLEDKYQVVLANSGTMAIKYLTLGKPDLILLDYEMPVADGKQVLEMIRSEVEFADIPVIFLTSKNDKESVASVMRLKPEGYLLKTLPPMEIIKSIDDFFAKQKSKLIK